MKTTINEFKLYLHFLCFLPVFHSSDHCNDGWKIQTHCKMKGASHKGQLVGDQEEGSFHGPCNFWLLLPDSLQDRAGVYCYQL